MSKHGAKPKKMKSQKLIIPKGTIDFNDTAVIEIPPEYRNQDVVIAKKSTTSTHSRSVLDDSLRIEHRHSQRVNYSSQTRDPRYDRPLASSSCQTVFDESDIEKLMADLETYYQAQKKFLIKSSTLIRKKADQYPKQQTPGLCDCAQQQGCSLASPSGCRPTIVVLKDKCFDSQGSSCSMSSVPQGPQYHGNKTWESGMSTRMNVTPQYDDNLSVPQGPQYHGNQTWDSGMGTRLNVTPQYDDNLSKSRNVPQDFNVSQPYSFYNYGGPASDSFRSQNISGIPQDPSQQDISYDLFREDVSRNFGTTRSDPMTSSQIRFDTTIPAKPILRRPNTSNSGLDDSNLGYHSMGRTDTSLRSSQDNKKVSVELKTLLTDSDIKNIRNEFKEARKNLDEISKRCDSKNCPSNKKAQK